MTKKSSEIPSRVYDDLVATILDTATESNAVDCGGTFINGLEVPANLTGTSVSFLVCSTYDGTYQELNDSSGNPLSATIASSKSTNLFPDIDLRGWKYVKLVLGTAQSGNDIAIKLLTRPY